MTTGQLFQARRKTWVYRVLVGVLPAALQCHLLPRDLWMLRVL